MNALFSILPFLFTIKRISSIKLKLKEQSKNLHIKRKMCQQYLYR